MFSEELNFIGLQLAGYVYYYAIKIMKNLL